MDAKAMKIRLRMGKTAAAKSSLSSWGIFGLRLDRQIARVIPQLPSFQKFPCRRRHENAQQLPAEFESEAPPRERRNHRAATQTDTRKNRLREPPSSSTSAQALSQGAAPAKRVFSHWAPDREPPEWSAYLPRRAENGTMHSAERDERFRRGCRSNPRRSNRSRAPAKANPSREGLVRYSGSEPRAIALTPRPPPRRNEDRNYRYHRSGRTLPHEPFAKPAPREENWCVPSKAARKFPSSRRAAALRPGNRSLEYRSKLFR